MDDELGRRILYALAGTQISVIGLAVVLLFGTTDFGFLGSIALLCYGSYLFFVRGFGE